MENKKEIMGDKEISELEMTLIENLNVYIHLIKRMNLTQPKLCLTAILNRDICWIIGLLERIKQDGGLIDYRIGWAKNTLRIISVKPRREIMVIIVNLIRNRLFHGNSMNNIHIHIIGVIK